MNARGEPKADAPRASPTLLDAIFDQSPMAISLSRASDGYILRVNDQFCEIYGRTREELVGKASTSLGIWVHPELRGGLVAGLQSTGHVRGHEFLMRRGDGAFRQVILNIDLIHHEGEACLLASSVDVSAHRIAEASAARMLRAIETSPDAIITVDEQGCIVTWNRGAEEMYGYTAQEVLGQHGLLLVPHELVDEGRTLASTLLAGSTVRDHETKRRRKNGSLVDVSMTISPVLTPEGKLAGYTGIARDITQRKATEDEERRHMVARKLVRRILREMVSRAETTMSARRDLGRSLAEEAHAATVEDFLDAFHAMNIGALQIEVHSEGRYEWTGTNLLEVTPGFASPTCHIALGYLEGTVAKLEGASSLGSETRCQSQGHAECRFVVKARASR